MRIPKATVALVVLALVAACAGPQIPFRESKVVPGVEAAAVVTADANGNSRVKFSVKHLAPANRLVPPKTFYVVWAQNAAGRAVPLGRLWIGEDREGSFQSTVPFIEFRVIITAEDQLVPEKPSEPIVLSTGLLKPKTR